MSVGLADTINTYKDFEAAMSQVQAISGFYTVGPHTTYGESKGNGSDEQNLQPQKSAEAFNYMLWQAGTLNR